MTEEERRLLVALAWMCAQYIGAATSSGWTTSAWGAGEEAIDLLVQYGLVDPSGRGGVWTEAGKALLNST